MRGAVSAPSVGRAIEHLAYFLIFFALILIALVLLLIVVFVGPACFIAWMLARFFYWVVTSSIIAVEPENWSRLHRWPPVLNFVICGLIGVAGALLLYCYRGEIGAAYAGFMLDVEWPFVGWIGPFADRPLAQLDCKDADACKTMVLGWIDSSPIRERIGTAIGVMWLLAVLARTTRAAAETRRICMIERAP